MVIIPHMTAKGMCSLPPELFQGFHGGIAQACIFLGSEHIDQLFLQDYSTSTGSSGYKYIHRLFANTPAYIAQSTEKAFFYLVKGIPSQANHCQSPFFLIRRTELFSKGMQFFHYALQRSCAECMMPSQSQFLFFPGN